MSEDEACRRVAAARLVRRFPIALGMIDRGEIHLTALLLLRDHLTDENHEELLRAAVHRSKKGIQHLIAERFPQPAVPSVVQRLSFTSPVPQSVSATPSAAQSVAPATAAHSTPSPQARAVRIEPLSRELYKVQFTASSELARKLERAADLMRHQNPSGDLAILMERAVDLLIAKLEKQRLGKTTRRPRAPPRETRRGYVPRAVRRQVFERDGERCTFVDEAGRRCESRTLLELDHLTPRALGGTDDADNLTVRCRRHNALSAERDSGATTSNDARPRRRTKGPTTRASATKPLTTRASATKPPTTCAIVASAGATKRRCARSAVWVSRTARPAARSKSSRSAWRASWLHPSRLCFARRFRCWRERAKHRSAKLVSQGSSRHEQRTNTRYLNFGVSGTCQQYPLWTTYVPAAQLETVGA